MENPAVVLEQAVCQSLGWAVRYYKDAAANGCWAAEVQIGLGRSVSFTSSDTSAATKKGAKVGKRAAAAAALEGLAGTIAAERAKPELSLAVALGQQCFDSVEVQPSSPASWAAFWASSPQVVGIDVEGNQQSPPVLVQIATASLVILEAPASAGALSPNLARLFADDGVTKVFCDGTGCDKRCLGLSAAAPMITAPVVELEHLANARIGEAKVARGFAKIFTLSYASQRGARIVKDPHGDDAAFFAEIEQGYRPQLGGLHEIPKATQQYAALDAWATLLVWVHLSHSGSEDDKPAWSHVRVDGT